LALIPGRKGGTGGSLLRRPGPGVTTLLAVTAIGLILCLAGAIALYPDPAHPHAWMTLSRVRVPSFWFLDPANGPNRYHTLSPIEGPALIWATIAAYATLLRERR
jgi:hypothetical protein